MRRSYIQRKAYTWKRSGFMQKRTLAPTIVERPKRASTLNAYGKKGREWIAVRRQLSAEFAAQGITSCELGYESCWRETALGWAHGKKRRHLKGDELKTLTILACNRCHDRIEHLPAAEMLAIVETVIRNRKVAA